MLLTEAQVGACLAVRDAPEAWSRWGDVATVWGQDALDALVGLGLLEPWERPDYRAVTFSPLGAHRLGLVLEENWKPATEGVEERTGPLSVVTEEVRVMVEIPRWVARAVDPRTGDPVPLRPKVVLPKHARIGSSIARLDRVAAPPPPPAEFLCDDDGREVRLFAGPSGAGGVAVRIDRRLRGRGRAG